MAKNSDTSRYPGTTRLKLTREAAISEHRSIAALMQEALPGESAEDVMRRKCRQIIAHGKSFGWEGPPFDPELLASLHDILVESSEDDFEGDGRIFPRCGRVVIQYRPGRTIERQRFTICHEIAHTCFPDFYEFVRYQNANDNDDPAHREFEHLCDVGASELLMPLEEFLRNLNSASICMQHAVALSGQFTASIDATLKRILDLTPHSCAAAFLTNEPFKEFSAVSDQMRVRWMWKSVGFKLFCQEVYVSQRTVR
jgi:hypothetical protein